MAFLNQGWIGPAHILFALLIGHALADFPFQGDYLSKGKNRFAPLDGTPWYWCMAAHCAIHAGFVWLITGCGWFGLAEFIFHFRIDDAKCQGEISYDTDQSLHIFCKIVWVSLLLVITR